MTNLFSRNARARVRSAAGALVIASTVIALPAVAQTTAPRPALPSVRPAQQPSAPVLGAAPGAPGTFGAAGNNANPGNFPGANLPGANFPGTGPTPALPTAAGLPSPSPYPQGLPSPQPFPAGVPSAVIPAPGAVVVPGAVAVPGAIVLSGTGLGTVVRPDTSAGAPGNVAMPGPTVVPGPAVLPDARGIAGTAGGAGLGVPATPQSVPAGSSPYTALQLAQSFRAADANLNGELTRAEAARLTIMPYTFEEMDRNKDGILSRSEYELGVR